MKFKAVLAALLAAALSYAQPAQPAATLLPNGEQCFQATTGVNGMVGLLGSITGGSLYTNGTYGGVALTGGSGSGATANIVVSGGIVTQVTVLNPGLQYVVGDNLSAAAATIGGTGLGFSVAVSSTSINSSLAGGTVAFYIPNTNTFKQTWFNSDQAASHQNTNPVNLDQNGCAVIYGTGFYRQVLKDSLGNTVWDKPTADTSANNSVFWAGNAGGTQNTITVVDPGFNATDGSIIQFVATATNTLPATLNPSGFGAVSITKPTTTGPALLVAGDITIGNIVTVIYSASSNTFQIVGTVSSAASAGATVVPQGYLTLLPAASGGPVMGASDVIAATSVYYSPIVGGQVPVWNGTAFINLTFPELQLTLNSSWLANSIYDACVFSNNGVAALVTGPVWQTSTAGSGARGSGAGTTQLTRLNGLWVNAVQITGSNGASSFVIPANQCTYVGSISIDGSAGQVSAYRTYGQSRKFGVWNQYNRQPIYLKAGDPTASWTYGTVAIRPANNNVANNLQVFSGQPEEIYDLSHEVYFQTSTSVSASSFHQIGIGFNSVTTFSGSNPLIGTSAAAGPNTNFYQRAHFLQSPSIGINTVTALEQGGGVTNAPLIFGTESSMILSANWRG